MMAHYYHKPPNCKERCPFCPDQAMYNMVTLMLFIGILFGIGLFASLCFTKEQREKKSEQRYNEAEVIVKILPTDPPQMMVKSNGQTYITKFHGKFENYNY
jgi:hypothetical protein